MRQISMRSASAGFAAPGLALRAAKTPQTEKDADSVGVFPKEVEADLLQVADSRHLERVSQNVASVNHSVVE
jgi:hypothetical protein